MKTIEELEASYKGRMNKQQLILDVPLREKGQLFGGEDAIARAPFPEDDMGKRPTGMLKSLHKMIPTITSVKGAANLSKKLQVKEGTRSIDQADFDEMMARFKKLKIDAVGYAKIEEKDVFKDLGVPYSHVIVFLAHQDLEPVLTSPSSESQVEVVRIYGVTGVASNKISIFLDKKGYGAMPGHSLGGSVDYTKLGRMAGLGEIGRHGLLIEPGSGPNHRLGVVYTNIENLGDYFTQDQDHSWVQDFCSSCGKCVRKCPGKAIRQEAVTNENGHTTSIEFRKCHTEFGSKWGCNVCVSECPFTTAGYDKLKTITLRKKAKSA